MSASRQDVVQDVVGDQGRPETGCGKSRRGSGLLGSDGDPRLEACLRARAVQDVGESVAGRVVNPGAIGEVLQLHGVAGCGGIVGGDHDDELLGAEGAGDTGPVARLRSDREVGLAGVHRLDELVGVAVLEEPDADVGMRLPPAAQRLGEHAERDRVERGDLQLADLEPCRLACGTAGAFGVGEGGARVGEHRAAGRGEPDRAREALEQRAAG